MFTLEANDEAKLKKHDLQAVNDWPIFSFWNSRFLKKASKIPAQSLWHQSKQSVHCTQHCCPMHSFPRTRQGFFGTITSEEKRRQNLVFSLFSWMTGNLSINGFQIWVLLIYQSTTRTSCNTQMVWYQCLSGSESPCGLAEHSQLQSASEGRFSAFSLFPWHLQLALGPLLAGEISSMSPFVTILVNFFYSHGLLVYYLEHKVGESPPPLVEVNPAILARLF